MIIGIHQPNYLPYPGFFHKIKDSDLFVILDDAQFSKGDFHNRNKIKTKDGFKWLTVPVHAKKEPINKIKINKDFRFSRMSWNEYHLHLIYENYRKSAFLSSFKQVLESFYNTNYNSLIDVNMKMINIFCNIFEINKKLVLSSSLGIPPNIKSTERLAFICEALGAKKYLSGPDGKNYMDLSIFSDKKIEVIFQEYYPVSYKQNYGEFLPYMSALDAYLNCGELI